MPRRSAQFFVRLQIDKGKRDSALIERGALEFSDARIGCRATLNGPQSGRSGPGIDVILAPHSFRKEIPVTQATARHILVDSEEKCLSLKEQIEGGADFAEVAREHSTCPSSSRGGDLGQFGHGVMVPEFDEVVFSANVGEVQGPVKTQFGYHLLEVTSRDD
jgi:peptidyl-prolyl cis-trans isomerase C